MKKKSIFVMALVASGFISGCGNSTPPAAETPSNATMNEPGKDNSKGKGKYTEVALTHPLDKDMIKNGQNVFNVKCAPCHKTTEEKLVGPGWKGVTDRRTPEWIMNFVTNTDEMIDKDPAAQELLDKCMVRMPNQHLSDADARSVLEFMRSNDGKQ